MRLILALIIVVLLAGCSGTTSTPSATTGPPNKSVALDNNHFLDGNMTVPVGTTVTYTDTGTHGHTVTIHWVGDPLTTFKIDKTLATGESTSYTFATAGTYHVFCRFHGTMTTGMATIVMVQ